MVHLVYDHLSESLSRMAVAESAAQEIRRFVDMHQCGSALNQIATLDDLNALLKQAESPLAASLIPLEQATRPPKILVDSGTTQTDVPWRILQCPGGPLVLQMICKKVNFALWIQEC
jgi:hypothetical protein